MYWACSMVVLPDLYQPIVYVDRTASFVALVSKLAPYTWSQLVLLRSPLTVPACAFTQYQPKFLTASAPACKEGMSKLESHSCGNTHRT